MRYFTGTLFAFCLFAILPSITQAASFTTNDFITTWDTTKSGTSNSQQITIPGTGAGYSYSIYWESLSSSTATGTIATSTSASQTITFPEAGQYKVAIKGTYPRIYFNNGGDKLKILTVEQWGNNPWTSMQSAFYGCANLTVPATDAPNLSGVTSLSGMFRDATSFNQSINHWNVSNVTSMSDVFRGATSFNQPLNSWDVSRVTNFSWFLYQATSYNQPLDNWDISSATTLRAMFSGTDSFNQPLNQWNTASVTNMVSTFYRAYSFNQPLDNWDVSNVNDMHALFGYSAFNQDISNWNVSNVRLMFSMFFNNTTFNKPLNNWDTSNVLTTRAMFYNATAFNQPLNNWNIANVTASTSVDYNGMDVMFYNAGLSTTNLDSTLTSWAGQSLHSNVPFHLGLKTYTSTGATALATLRDTYNWTISEQYWVDYQEGDNYTISGTTTQSHISNGSSTTPVEVIPDDNCTFTSWSDGNTTNPRTDTPTDNLTLTANVTCRTNSSGSSATTRYKKLLEYGNTTEAEAIKNKYLTPNNSSALSTAITTITTLTTNPTITNNPQTRQQLITILQQLVVLLERMRGE
jgi:surface protein